MNNEMTTEYMSNEEVIEVLKGIVFGGFDRTTRKERQALDVAIKALENERPQGEWKHIGGDEWVCSECGHVITTEGSWENPLSIGAYRCENCGAEMRLEEPNVHSES